MRLLHLPFLLILVVPIITRCEKQHAINQTEVAEHVRYLSSDELMGRKSLTPGIEKAENYIAGEFKKAKLGYFSGLDTYKQSFDLIEYSISETSISVNGKELPSEDYFAFLHTDSIDWKNGDIQTATIAEDSNFRSEFRTITRSENDLIVFVDYSHEETFHKYQPYFSKPAQNIEGSTDPSIVFILTSVTPKTFKCLFIFFAFFLIDLSISKPPLAWTVIYLHFFKSFKLSIADKAVWGISFIFKSNQKSILIFSKNFLPCLE